MLHLHLKKQSEIKAGEVKNTLSEKKREQVTSLNKLCPICNERISFKVEAAAKYFRTRLRILELTSHNSWAPGRPSK